MRVRKNRPEWYLNGVKDKENRDWTLNEGMLILTLREKGVPSEEIAEKIQASVVQIYNVTRQTRKLVNNKCYICGEPLTAKELKANSHRKRKNCFKCKKRAYAYKKHGREEAVKNGLCGYCQKRKAEPGTKSCRKCVSASHRRRYKRGICGVCGENKIDKRHSITMCAGCLREMREKAKTRREHANSKQQ